MRECQVCKNCYADSVTTCPKDGTSTTHTIQGEPVLEGKYHLDMRLGQGGMGVVYKARHAYLKTQLAIKIILPDLVGNDPELVTRFRQEALAAAAIRHQNVVSVTDYGVIGGSTPFLVMEYVEGESLHDLLAREKKLSPENAFELMSAICAGVGAAHSQGIVHRDLKPLNIMICSGKPNLSQSVKILDFGLAKIKSGELLGSFVQAQTTGLMGSPYYMAPEQWADEDPDTRADIYSLGVMLYQMLAGDVPFKGSSIPAIMKKHISDQAPTFAESGTAISPQLEQVVLHTLIKQPGDRTASVDQLVDELRAAIFPGFQSIHPTPPNSLPVSSLRIRSKPPESNVYVDNVPVGRTADNGDLLVDGIQSGNHHLRVSHDGFVDWMGAVVCDGSPQEVVAELRDKTIGSIPIPMPGEPGAGSGATSRIVVPTGTQHTMPPDPTFDATLIAGGNGRTTASGLATQKRGISPLVWGIVGLLGLFVIVISGVGVGAYFGVFSRSTSNGTNGSSVTPGTNSSPAPPSTPVAMKAEMAEIPGGTFNMGRDDGPLNEQPANPVTVEPFYMDTSEVTNAEFYEFIRASGYQPTMTDKFLAQWVNDKPVVGQEKAPVRFVNVADIEAFANWRSKRDGLKYRLPTEAEWEYAARNGAKGSLYPWGDGYKASCAVLDQEDTEPKDVGSQSCPNDWGVYDLIGNVFEWTGTKAFLYPGSKGEMAPMKEPRNMIRGGAALNKSSGDFKMTSTFRADVDIRKRDKELGFRLVRSDQKSAK